MKRYPLIMYISLSLLLTGFVASLVRAQQLVLLPEELKGVEIADNFIDSGSEEIGEIQTVTGHVVVFHEDNKQAYYASNGDPLFKQDIVYTLTESRCRIKFTTEDIITMGDNTRIGIESYFDSPETGEKRSVIRLLKGKAMFYMLKLFKYKIIDTAVNTPTAIIGVRGTQFGTEVRPVADMKAEIAPRPIYLADASGSLNWLSQAPSGRPETETIVHCFEGAVEVSSPIDQVSKMLGEGQSLDVSSVGVGTVRRTDPEVAGKFKTQTEAPAPESSESDEGSSGEQGESEAEASSEDIGGEEQTAEGVDTSLVQDVTQNQTTKKIEEHLPDLDRGGYFAAMLTRIEGGEKKFQHLYISDRGQEFETGDTSLKARDVLGGDPGNPLVLIGGGDVTQEAQGNTDARLLSVEVDPGTGRETITGPFVVNDVSIDRDEFMDWGYWTVPQIMTSPSGDQYAVDNRAYYVEGETAPMTMKWPPLRPTRSPDPTPEPLTEPTGPIPEGPICPARLRPAWILPKKRSVTSACPYPAGDIALPLWRPAADSMKAHPSFLSIRIPPDRYGRSTVRMPFPQKRKHTVPSTEKAGRRWEASGKWMRPTEAVKPMPRACLKGAGRLGEARYWMLDTGCWTARSGLASRND